MIVLGLSDEIYILKFHKLGGTADYILRPIFRTEFFYLGGDFDGMNCF